LPKKQQHVDLGGGRKRSTMLYSGDTPLGMHLVPTTTGQGAIVEGVSGQAGSHADASNVGQVLLSVNDIDVTSMSLAEVLTTVQANRPATLVFMHPETKVKTQTHVDLGGGRKKSTMLYNGDSPLGMHLVPTPTGQGVIVEGVSDQSAHADASNVGQVLVSVNGIDVAGMPLPQVLKTLQENRPAELVFMHPEIPGIPGPGPSGPSGARGARQSVVTWSGNTPLGMHLETAAGGEVVRVGAVNHDSEHADQSHVGQHLVAVNGVDTSRMPLAQTVELLRTTAKPITLTFQPPDIAEQVEEQRIIDAAAAAAAAAASQQQQQSLGGGGAAPAPSAAMVTVQWPPGVSLGLNLTQCGVGRADDRSALVESVMPQSPLLGKVKAGHALTSVNGQDVQVRAGQVSERETPPPPSPSPPPRTHARTTTATTTATHNSNYKHNNRHSGQIHECVNMKSNTLTCKAGRFSLNKTTGMCVRVLFCFCHMTGHAVRRRDECPAVRREARGTVLQAPD
jgi:hypothetical protein